LETFKTLELIFHFNTQKACVLWEMFKEHKNERQVTL